MANEGATVIKKKLSQGQRATRIRHLGYSLLTSGPGLAWLMVFMMAPFLAILIISFLSRGEYGEVIFKGTFDNYLRFFGFGILGFDPLFPLVLARSLVLGFATSLLCLATGLPMAFFIAGLPPRFKGVALTLVVIPLWTNLLIRTYAWQIMLAPGSLLAEAAAWMGWVPEGTPLYPSMGAVYIGMVCDFLPFLVLPLYTSVEKLDWSLVEAAMDLGADRWRAFQHAILPQIMPGLVAGVVLVFMPATGQFVVPDLLGGAKTMLLGNAIQQEFGVSQDWPFGSAITVLAMILVFIGLFFYAQTAGRKGDLDIA
jgi:spermidine/putrescine transport system permease protein